MGFRISLGECNRFVEAAASGASEADFRNQRRNVCGPHYTSFSDGFGGGSFVGVREAFLRIRVWGLAFRNIRPGMIQGLN